MPTTVPLTIDSELMNVLRQLSLATALVADARDQRRVEQAAAAQVYLREAMTTLDRIAQQAPRSLTV